MSCTGDTFGYITHSTINVGDDFQAIAAKRFLPADAIPIHRELISEFNHHSPVRVVVSGWFMQEGASYWDLPGAPPERSWPPSPQVDPLFISLHLTQTFHATVFAPSSVEYLRAHAPVGARDMGTLEALCERDIPCYFSGCLTLTLPSTPTRRRDVIYLVDLDAATTGYIRSRTRTPIVELTHGKPILALLTPEHRLQYAEHVLGLYRAAKCVVTTRLHAALPCLAFGTPVLMLPAGTKGCINPRCTGLIEHLPHGSTEELVHGELDYDFDDPPPNPTSYLALRESMSRTMTEWVSHAASEAAHA
jgi:hypothetical protein